jgi:hypothetical protein
MSLRQSALLLSISVLICVAGLLLLPTTRRNTTALSPTLGAPEQPYDVLISCESRKGSGNAVYGPVDAPTFGLFVGCSPKGDFSYDIPSTTKEMYETKRNPEVVFELSDLGELKNAVLSRSSGSTSLDVAAVKTVSSRQYAPTKCGACTIVVRIAVEKKYRNPDPLPSVGSDGDATEE